jgi:O-antigen ligase
VRIERSLVARRAWVLPGWPRYVYPALLLLVLGLPFDALQPLPGLPFNDLKLLLGLLGLAWLVSGSGALPSPAEARMLAPTLLLFGVAVLSALQSGDYQSESLRFTVRFAVAAFVMLVAARVTRSPHHLKGVLWAVVVGAGVSALLGLGEAAGWPTAESVLGLFKTVPTRVAGQLRVGASFQYATIAAMYFEMATPLAVCLAATTKRVGPWLLATAVACACSANIVLSLTRTGIATLAVLLGVLLALGWCWRCMRSAAPPTLAAAAVLIGLLLVAFARDPVFNLRLASENDADWYGATYVAPSSLTLRTDSPQSVEIEVANTGRITWRDDPRQPFELSYRWLTGDGSGVLDAPRGEARLPRDVAPGETVRIQTTVSAADLPAGAYRLAWDMRQRDVVQFSERGWAEAETLVEVANPRPAPPPAVEPREEAVAPWVVPRVFLWQAALSLFRQHPILGVGPDNFRHLYGAELGLEGWDERVQANNMYLEILADLGVLGVLALAWLLVVPLARAVRRVRRLPGPDSVLLVGVCLALGAFLLHGLLDTFVAFTSTALLFWLCLGVAHGATE